MPIFLALEFGFGTKIKVTDKVDLDIGIKYYDYGKHRMSEYISKKITGYKFTIGGAIKIN